MVVETIYERLSAKLKQSEREFGCPMYRGVMWHSMPDKTIVASWCGDRFFEVHPNNDTYLIIHKGHTCGVTNRWPDVLYWIGIPNNIQFNVNNIKTATGVRKVEVFAFNRVTKQQQKVTTADKVKLTFTLDANSKIQFAMEGCEPSVKAVKDNRKYRAFNKDLDELINILITQVRVGAYDNHRTSPNKYNALMDLSKTYIGEKIDSQVVLPMLAIKWTETKNPDLLEPVFNAVMHSTSSTWYPHGDNPNLTYRHNDMIRRVKLRKKRIQQYYLQNQCVKMVDSNGTLSTEDESNDQDGQLLAHDGFREVQVSSEAEVC